MVLRQIDIPIELNREINIFMADKEISNKEEAILKLISKGLDL